jgi:hypothetical protein
MHPREEAQAMLRILVALTTLLASSIWSAGDEALRIETFGTGSRYGYRVFVTTYPAGFWGRHRYRGRLQEHLTGLRGMDSPEWMSCVWLLS